MRSRHVATGLGLLATAGLLAACSSAVTSGAALPASEHGAAGGSSSGTTTDGSTASAPAAITIGMPPTADVQRSVRAAYTVPSGAFLTSFDGVIARAVGLAVTSQPATTPAAGGRIVAGSVTLQIPSASLASFLNGMPSTFVASSIDFSSVDHYAAFVDVNAELTLAHAQLYALDGLLAKATTLADITTIEQRIETVQVAIDTYQGQLNGLTASVAMASVTVALAERGSTLVAAVPSALNNGLSSGWRNAGQVTGALVHALVTAVPVLVILGVVLAGWLIPAGSDARNALCPNEPPRFHFAAVRTPWLTGRSSARFEGRGVAVPDIRGISSTALAAVPLRSG